MLNKEKIRNAWRDSFDVEYPGFDKHDLPEPLVKVTDLILK